MKKLIYCALALAAGLFATSCQQENLEPVAQENTVTFTVETPASLQTKAIADGMNVDKLIYEVWLTPTLGDLTTGAQKLFQKDKDMTVQNGVNKTVITLDLVNDQKYTVLLWAQKNGTGVYDTDELNDVHYNSTEAGAYAANDERLAAFYGVAYVNDGKTVTKEGTEAPARVELRRPFAQVNLGTLNTSTEQGSTTGYIIDIKESNMILRNVPTHFNVVNGMATVPAEMEFLMYNAPCKEKAITDEDATLPGFDNPKYWYAGMNYVFASNEETGITAELEYNIKAKLNEGSEVVVNNKIPNVPLKENYRTNIVGNLLTSSTDYEVVIDADFNNPEYVRGDEWSQNGNYNYTINANASEGTLKAVLEHADAAAKAAATKAAGPEVKITLNGDVEWETGAGIGSTPLLREDSPISAVVINGDGKTFTATGNGVGQIRLANGALLTFNNVKVVDHSVSYAENSWEYGYLEFGGKLAFNGCQFVNAIMMESENAAFTNCSFNSNHDNEYAVWVSKGNATFNGCTFTGARGLKVHEAYGSEVTSVVVDGCTFSQLTKKPGIALGDLNAQTSVTIQNSTFDRCQAGDQGNYMYETDTDVTTFNFDRKNNVVIPSGDGVVEQENGTLIVSSAAGLKAAIAAANNNEFTVIRLADGTYTGAFDIAAKSVKIVAMNRHQATIDGLVHGLDFAHVTLEGVVLTNATPAASASARHNADYYCLGSYVTDWVIEDCIFNVNNQGQAAGKGAINIYAGRDDYELYDGFEFTVKNTVCNCNGERPIRGKTNSWVEGCTFVDQHRYAIQVQGNSGLASETVKFVKNTIVDPCKTSGEAYVASVSISKSQLIEDAAFIIEGNTDAKFVYDNHANVKITTCTLNGTLIAAGQCVSIPGVDDAKEVIFEYEEGTTLAATSEDLTAALDAKAAKIVLMPGEYEGVFAIKADGTTIEGQEGAKVHCINLNGKNNVTLKKITFDAAGAQYSYDGRDGAKQKANIISADKGHKTLPAGQNITIYECSFTGEFVSGGVALSFTDQTRTGSGNVTIEKCTFNTTGGYCDIYGHYFGNKNNFVVKDNVFNSDVMNQTIYMGRYASSVPVVITGNKFKTKTSIEEAVALQDHSNYGVSIDASNNTFGE